MKKDIWKQLKKQNDGRQLNLEVSDQKYIDKIVAYAINRGMGMMETEIIRKDLIGMGLEAKKAGETLESRLGNIGEFAEELVAVGKLENRKEEKYYFIKKIGFWYMALAILVLLLFLMLYLWKLPEAHMNLGGFLYGLFMFPWIIALYDLHILGRFAMKKWYGILFLFVSMLTIFSANIWEMLSPGILGRAMKQYLPFFDGRIPEGCYMLLLLLGMTLYAYGRKKFLESVEQTAKEHHLQKED